ncbi:MAG: hypothetical protein AMK73_06345 [Planctomycetes bacterium SM23_32]|nr:MAG: hypothetical protein AMK73_06345 [Planctomycetes bacterium SM23_32]
MAIIKRETDYAVRALRKLAGADDFVSVSVLAEGEDVPAIFLRKIMQRLNRAGMVQSRQGPFGGYRLNVAPEDITLLDVVETVQGPLVMNECFVEPEVCRRTEFCPVRVRLAELQVELNARLAEVTLGEVFSAEPAGEGAAR